MDKNKMVAALAGVTAASLIYQNLKLKLINEKMSSFCAEAGEAMSKLNQLAIDVEFEDITRDLDI